MQVEGNTLDCREINEIQVRNYHEKKTPRKHEKLEFLINVNEI